MEYSILIDDSPESLARFAGPAAGTCMSQWQPFVQALSEAGLYVAGAGLQPPGAATTLRFIGDKRQVQDGPYADTKEQLAGIVMTDVPDRAQALAWAPRFPMAPERRLELRADWVPLHE